MTRKKKLTNEDIKHTGEARVRGGIYALLLCTIMMSISVVIYVTIEADILRELDEVQFNALEHMEEEIHYTIDEASTYVHQISVVPQTSRAIKGNQLALMDSENTFKELVEYNTFVDKMRLIDLNGDEQISVSEEGEGIAVIKADKDLLNQSERYYFMNSVELDKGMIFISDLDLEMTGGEIVKPYNPVIRISTMLYDDIQPLGMVVLNYKAVSLFEMISAHNTHTYDDWYLIDENGYFLKGPSAELEFGSVIEARKTKGMFSENPEAWHDMNTWTSGKTEVDGGWLYYKKLCPMNQAANKAGCKDWYVAINVPQASVEDEVSRIVLGLQIGNVVLIPLLAGLGWSLGNYQIRNKYYKIKLENQARIDPLTGLYNRRFINEMLEQHIQMSMRREEDISIIYIDLNDLKTVNDHYGHELGDVMIKEAAQAMLANIRKTDEVARLGGDEFMIVLPNCSTERINTIMERVIDTFKDSGQRHVKKEWTLSWGTSSWLGESDSIQNLINRADTAMYVHKKTFKYEPIAEEISQTK